MSRRFVGFALTVALAACAPAAADPNAAVYDAWRAQRSRLEVTARGDVARDLGLRRGPSGLHEGFLLHLRGAGGHGLTVRVETNVDITGPVAVHAGDAVEVRGEYVYDARGGLIHYTHHDPRLRHPGGYLRVGDRTFQ
ncbi:MAG: DUF3465 domain-containing protein [Candidatus Eremiobacteraeota bacterium]|nr:DUF3465 domain-containing protein [Candidatus Eremiobacteraeota bacterium]